MSSLVLYAPLEGWCSSLDEAPDPVFSGRMLGDGVALDPTGATLHAPCDGELILIPASKHAVTLRAPNGAEILIHIGIDTVELKGEGFELHVRQGDTVRRGAPLITFDLDWLARRAKSLLTPLIVVNGDQFRIARREQNRAIKVGDVLLELVAAGGVIARTTQRTASNATAPGGTVLPEAGRTTAALPRPVSSAANATRSFIVPLAHGVHARPAATFAACAKRFASTVTVHAHDRQANGKSAVSLMSLGIRHGDEITIDAAGSDASQAVAALIETLLASHEAVSHTPARADNEQTTSSPAAAANANRDVGGNALPGKHHAASAATFEGAVNHSTSGGLRERDSVAHSTGAAGGDGESAALLSLPQHRQLAPGERLPGVVASRGLAVGRAVQLVRADIHVVEEGAGVARERAALQQALDAVRGELQQRVQAAHGARKEIAEAHLEFIEDPELRQAAQRAIAEGKSAAFAWRTAIQAHVSLLKGAGDQRLVERVDDLLDLENQVQLALQGQPAAGPQTLPENAILIARELLPSQLASLDPARLAGICTAGGGPTSHVAILASAMGIPALVAVGAGALHIADGTTVLLDAENGAVHVDPAPQDLQAAERTLAARRARRAAEQAAAQRDCRTADGVRIEVFANVGSLADARAAVAQGAEGCGLLRTEFLFLDRQSPPDEEEQTREYQAIATAFAPRPIVVRTLDIGGDKPIPYLPLPHEDNPALGLRGVRTSLWRMDLFRTQLRAVLRVEPHEQCSLLLPMITSPAEIRAVRAVVDEIRHECNMSSQIALGVMIETPASAVIADQLAQEADFLSIGTNDLTQYTLAMDRGHPELAAQLDALHPAVLRLIANTAKAGRAHNRPVAVCGGLASDPSAAPILIGLGVTELSAIPSVIPQLKAVITALTLEDCRDIARRALEQASAEAVRAQLRERAADTTGAPA